MVSQSFEEAFGQIAETLGMGDSVLVLPIDIIDEDPGNPRTRFDEAELTALADTIARKGLLQPLTVRPPDAAGRYRLRFGARRLRAARMAGVREVRALVQFEQLDPAEAIVEQLIENDQRESLSTSDLAQAVARLLELKVSQVDIGRRLGRPKEQIAMLASIREMPGELRALAPQLGLRTLYELFAAWKADADRTKVWLAGREPATITQAAARDLARRPVPSRRLVRDPADGSVRKVSLGEPIEEARPKPLQARGAPAQPAWRVPVVEVQVDDVSGVLVLDPVGRATDRVKVMRADGVVVSARAADVRIVRLKPG